MVTPETFSFLTKITPAPKKPIAETTLDATREASTFKPSEMFKISKKPYLETIIMSAEDSATMMCVLIPAVLSRLSLSTPIKAPQRADNNILRM